MKRIPASKYQILEEKEIGNQLICKIKDKVSNEVLYSSLFKEFKNNDYENLHKTEIELTKLRCNNIIHSHYIYEEDEFVYFYKIYYKYPEYEIDNLIPIPKRPNLEKENLIYLNLTQKKKTDIIKKSPKSMKNKKKLVCKVCKNTIDIKKEELMKKNILFCELCNTVIYKNIMNNNNISPQKTYTSKEYIIKDRLEMLLIKKSIKTLFSTKIYVTKDKITVYFSNIPTKKIKTSEISQLYVKLEKKHLGKRFFRLKLLFKNNQTISIVKSSNAESLLFLERTIEDWLNIEDVEVAEEIKG